VDYFEIVGEIRNVETIAVGRAIRDLAIVEKRFAKATGGSSRDLPRFA